MNKAVRIGMGFGVTSGIITTLGLMVGLYSGTDSKLAILGGIIAIAVADAFSDSLGIHISEETIHTKKYKKIWESSVSTFFSKFITALIFIVAILTLPLGTAIIVNIVLGLVLLGILSYWIAKKRKENIFRTVSKHILVGIAVIIITYFLGELVKGVW